MRKVRLGKSNLWVTQIGMGGIPIMRLRRSDAVKLVRQVLDLGINFIDTAHVYGDSEEKIGEALEERRNQVILASKSPARDKKTFLEHLDLSLKRLRTDYLDIYHHHGVNSREKMEKIIGPGGAFEGMIQALKEGKVLHPAFSSHHLPEAEELMLTGKFEVMQIPFSFVDDEAKEKIIPLAQKLGIGFIAMKPMGGGLIEDARASFRYLLQFPQIVPDPGVEKIEEMREIVEIVENHPGPLTQKEKDRMKKIRQDLGKTFCHRCDYCQPCSENIPISLVLVFPTLVKRMPLKEVLARCEEAAEKVRDCSECEECIERCPYHLNIPHLLKENIAYMEKLKECSLPLPEPPEA